MQRGKNLIRKVKNNFMNFFVNKPKAFKFYDQALKYLDQHEIIYAQIGKFKRQIAFAVENIVEEINRLKSEGFSFLQEEPMMGADQKWVVFLHPKCTNGVLVELCQEIPN